MKTTVQELGYVGSQSITVVKAVGKILNEDETYRKAVLNQSFNILEPAMKIETEDMTEQVIEDLHKKTFRSLHAMTSSFYTMGLMVGYYAARHEISDYVQKLKLAQVPIAGEEVESEEASSKDAQTKPESE